MASGRLLAVPFVATAVALGACGGSAAQVPTGEGQAVPTQAPQVLTARQHQKTLRLARGRSIELRLAPGARVTASGGSVSLVPIDFFADPGYVAWELSGVRPGQTVLTGRSAGKQFRVTLVVPT